ncbi:MAG TPA: L-seryl-tRNA(Sec) selenium transferase, partial [Thermodesulfobacteriota bacterium]|nr:L-seryl-tRNA(Sec) selenium transferase [Thermodesulfobacteriota bacterium]
GPQAGIILGAAKWLDRIKENPLHRALRIDKLTLAALESTLRVYLDPERAPDTLPALGMLTCPAGELETRARRLMRKLNKVVSASCRAAVKQERSQVGGGALPLQELPTRVVALRPLNVSAAVLEERLRKTEPPVIARIKEDEVLLDPRTIAGEEEDLLVKALEQALQQ